MAFPRGSGSLGRKLLSGWEGNLLSQRESGRERGPNSNIHGRASEDGVWAALDRQRLVASHPRPKPNRTGPVDPEMNGDIQGRIVQKINRDSRGR